MPGSGTVQPILLNGTAQDISAKIVKARVNNSLDITELTKSVTDSTLTVSYTVSSTQARSIASIKLMDAASVALTSAMVYIPVETEVVLTHTITVQEATQNG